MRVRLLDATVENYFAARRVDYALSDLGLTLVEGVNRDDPGSPANGVGKSTLYLDAPTWCLFGEARSVGADDVVNDVAGRDCAVTCRLEVPEVGLVAVQRYRRVSGRNGLRLWVGAPVRDLEGAASDQATRFEVSALDVDGTQRMLEDMLGLDLEVWRAAVYRAQDDEERFAALTDSRQKELLTRIFRLDAIDHLRDQASLRSKELTERLTPLNARLERAQATVAALPLADLRAAQEAWIASTARRLADLDCATQDADATNRQAHGRVQRLRQLEVFAAQVEQVHVPLALEATPRAPVLGPVPTVPGAPMRRAPVVRPFPPAPAAEVPPPLLVDVRALEHEASVHEHNASVAQERARSRSAEVTALIRKAAAIAQKSSGACDECGAQLTPEHADREAGRLRGEATQVEGEADTHARGARTAALTGAGIRAHVDAIRREHADRVNAAAIAHRAAYAEWERQCTAEVRRAAEEAAELSHRDAEEWRVAAHAAAAAAAQVKAQNEALQNAWRAKVEEVSARNAAHEASARAGVEAQLAPLRAEMSALQGADAEYARSTQDYRSKGAERARVAAEHWPMAQAFADAVEKDRTARAEIGIVERDRAGLERELRLAEFWVEGCGAKGIKGLVLDERVQELTDRANGWLQVLTKGVYWIKAETQRLTARGKVSEKFTVRVFRHRRTGGIAERSWGAWSGGQKARVSVGIDLALADCVAARAKRAHDLLVLDEVFRHLDSGGRESMLDALHVLRRDRGSVVVVDHDPVMRASFDRKVFVELDHGETRIGAAE